MQRTHGLSEWLRIFPSTAVAVSQNLSHNPVQLKDPKGLFHFVGIPDYTAAVSQLYFMDILDNKLCEMAFVWKDNQMFLNSVRSKSSDNP